MKNNIIINEDDLPKELIDLINDRKNKPPFTSEDFEKYRKYKNLNINSNK